ncbi:MULTISPECIES: carboxymuconolactone decarboxylase family protein [Nitrospira]|uniref:Carboxymuconolactone decarboxylase family protein n=2 Tax=Nitrospira TaxID=1234 RepID=A0AA86T7F3_9BACT|nr:MULTISPECIES: carboxymuconolactone decarboxylase family protein [Nitrospira]CAE6731543.1 Carboxymuconolactone decarboxylase [Nitrospira defluvii]CAI4031743.1 Carboxymuconolactone decarboxylase family protein [Nitrospira tepida]
MKFQVHTKETAPEASRATVEATAKKYGFLPNLFGVLAESPTAVQAYAAINKALEQSALSPVEQQVVALTVSTTNDCAYCVGAHSTVAQMVRTPEDILAGLREQRPLSDRKLNALRTLVLSVMRHRGWVPEDDLEHFAAAGYGQRHLLDVLTIVALKTLSNYLNHIAHTQLDRQFASQAWSPKEGCTSCLTT